MGPGRKGADLSDPHFATSEGSEAVDGITRAVIARGLCIEERQCPLGAIGGPHGQHSPVVLAQRQGTRPTLHTQGLPTSPRRRRRSRRGTGGGPPWPAGLKRSISSMSSNSRWPRHDARHPRRPSTNETGNRAVPQREVSAARRQKGHRWCRVARSSRLRGRGHGRGGGLAARFMARALARWAGPAPARAGWATARACSLAVESLPRFLRRRGCEIGRSGAESQPCGRAKSQTGGPLSLAVVGWCPARSEPCGR